MKKMKRKLLFLLILSLCFLFWGCAEASEGELNLIDIPLTNESYAFGVDPGQPELLEQVNEFISLSLTDGTLDEIFEAYFGNGEPKAVVSAPRDENKDQLIVATNAMFAPFEYIVGKDFYGIDLELAAALAEHLGKELVIVDMDFDALCLSVGQGKCDLAVAGLTINESRMEHVVFSLPYYQASQRLLVPSENSVFANCCSTADLEAVLSSLGPSVKAGVQTGTTGQSYLQGDEDWDFPGYDVACMGYQSVALAVQDMRNGNLDFVLADEAPARLILESLSSSEGSTMAQRMASFLKQFREKGGYVLVLEGLRNTLLIAVLGLLIGICIGTIIATVRILPKYKRLPRIMDKLCTLYVVFFRGTPIVVQLLLGYYVLLPLLKINAPALGVCVVVFGLNSAAYVSEIMRGGIQSVDRGQLEAGRALGLSFSVSMLRIVLPQAVKNILPTLGNEFISLIKETSIVSFVSTVDIYKAFHTIATNSYEYIVPYLAMAVVYIVLIAGISLLIKLMERRLARSDKHLPSK